MSITNHDLSIKERVKQLSAEKRKLLATKLNLIGKQKHNQRLVACIKSVEPIANTDDIRQYVQKHLPEHFVPQSILLVEDFPRKEGGKINRDDLSSFAWNFQASSASVEGNVNDLSYDTSTQGEEESSDDYFAEYIAPTNETERALASIWSEVLGAGDISIHDNFFEVGGDSLLSIRILARANKAGLNIATEDFFEHPTIAEQAKLAKTSGKITAKEGKIAGQFNLIPIQHWFFRHIKKDQHHWNQSVMLETDKSLDFLSLERAIQKVLIQHDALRSVFVRNDKVVDGGWQQEFKPFQSDLPLQHLDLTGTAENELEKELEKKAQALNSQLHLEHGLLIKFLFALTADGLNNRLIIVVHHLIIDAESWRILLHDLRSSWQAFATGGNVELPTKTHSFKHWSKCLHEFLDSPQANQQKLFWQQQASKTVDPIPTDFTPSLAENTQKSTQHLYSSLNEAETSELTNSLSKLHGLEVTEGLLTALLESIFYWTQSQRLVIDIKGHGREPLFENIDVSRTIGWFTSIFPVVFEKAPESGQADAIGRIANIVKQNISAIPNKGIGHGILFELHQASNIKQRPNAQICFNYLGQIDKLDSNSEKSKTLSLAKKPTVDISAENIGQPRSVNGERAYLIEVNIVIANGVLKADWEYSDRFHTRDTIHTLATSFSTLLKRLISLSSLDHNTADSVESSSTTFDLADLDQTELAAISSILENTDE